MSKDYDLHNCKYCDTKIKFSDMHDNNGHIWFCESCEDPFCSKCIKEKTNINPLVDYHHVDKILCVECGK